MISIAIFTYKRLIPLTKCLLSINYKEVGEILIFNDDEKNELILDKLKISNNMKDKISIFQPKNFGFNSRAFRKPIYMNKAVDMCKTNKILFSDDDAVFGSKTRDT